jgi:hypothetical protein
MDKWREVPAKPDPLAGVPFPSREQDAAFRRAVRERGFSVSSGLVANIEDLDAPWCRLMKGLEQFSHSNARLAHQKHVADMAAKLRAGDAALDSEQSHAWIEAEFIDDFMLRRKEIKGQMRVIERQAAELVQPVMLAYSAALSALADEIEQPFMQQAEAFCCPHKSPPVVLMVRKAAAVAADPSTIPTGRPRNMLGDLV